MSYFISTPFGDCRAVVYCSKPVIPTVEVQELPDGDGPLFYEGGNLYRGAPVLLGSANPIDILAKENANLRSQLQEQSKRSDYLEDALCELDKEATV